MKLTPEISEYVHVVTEAMQAAKVTKDEYVHIMNGEGFTPEFLARLPEDLREKLLAAQAKTTPGDAP